MAAKPVWLAPPLLVYTPLVYVLLAYAWLPLLYLAVVHLWPKRGWVLLLVIMLMCGQWLCWSSVAPRQHIFETIGDTDAFAQRDCGYTSPEIYVCELKAGSSDNPDVWALTQTFRAWKNVPVVWLLESEFRVE